MNKIHIYQERLFDITIYISYGLIILSSLGFSQLAPKYLQILDYYVRVYICLFLMWRFNPFRTYYEFTELDRKIAFSAGAFILTTTVLNQYLLLLKNKAQNLIKTEEEDITNK
jgi:cytochrome c biogenesis protein CcdA